MISQAGVRAIAAVVETGSFEAAATRLGLTASAVSQRVRQIEEQVGAALVVRGRPCSATPAGRRICRHATLVGLLEQDLLHDLGLPAGDRVTVRVAVNADSLALWFIDALADHDGLLFDIVLADQDRAADLLRSGEVAAALGRTGPPVAGCDQADLGVLRYLACAPPAFIRDWFPGGIDAPALARAPSLRFGPDDRLQEDWAARLVGHPVRLPHHTLPSSHGFLDACAAGLGWAMNPAESAAPLLATGRLAPLGVQPFLDVGLCWRWLRSARSGLEGVNRSVQRQAARRLLPMAAGRDQA